MTQIIVSEGGRISVDTETAPGSRIESCEEQKNGRSVSMTTEQLASAVANLEQRIFSDAWSAQSVEETLSNPQALVLSVWKEDQMAGYVIFYYVLDEGEIARIAVSPDNRRQGIGRTLLQKLQKISARKGIARWLLDVRESNETAIAFYRDSGFVRDGVRKNFYANPKEDAILMSREVGM